LNFPAENRFNVSCSLASFYRRFFPAEPANLLLLYIRFLWLPLYTVILSVQCKFSENVNPIIGTKTNEPRNLSIY
jgi:hypothetical protein